LKVGNLEGGDVCEKEDASKEMSFALLIRIKKIISRGVQLR
jgi:hypothetical protein